MNKELIIRSNSDNVDFALLKDGKLIEFQNDEDNSKFSVGDVFLAKVRKSSGITKAIEDRIFEPKFTTKTSGMGLGLPMIKNMIDTYNGSISFSSTIEEGSQFTVRFPKQFTDEV